MRSLFDICSYFFSSQVEGLGALSDIDDLTSVFSKVRVSTVYAASLLSLMGIGERIKQDEWSHV